MSVIFTALFLLLSAATISSTYQEPLVSTPYGKIAGSYDTSYHGRKYTQFLSVPYAQPPVEDLRFEAPQPLKPWMGVWQANFTTVCAQLRHSAVTGGIYMGQEDCLYLSIFVPKLNDAHPLDVFFDIHGGGFNFGSGTDYAYPQKLMDKDVIFVRINYRLGVLGFLSTEDEVVPGNNGMKDQVEALKWVKNNIQYFGGNPDSITLTGLSAGGASVHSHYLSPLSKGLFKNGISISGNMLSPWVMQENPLQKAQEIATAVGCTQKSTYEFVKCLKQRSVTQIIESTRMHRPWLFNPFSPFGLVVEKYGDRPFLPDHPYQLLKKGKIQNLPWLSSTVSHEGLYPVADLVLDDEYLVELENRWNELAPLVLHYHETVSPSLLSDVSQQIKKFYLNEKSASIDTFQEIIKMASDRLFNVDIDKSLRHQAKANTAPVYYYYFTYEGEEMYTFTDLWAPSETRNGVCHGDDIAFIFPTRFALRKRYAENDDKMTEVLLNMWETFAKTGVPEVKGVEWDRISSNVNEPINYLHIKSPDNIALKKIDELGHKSFWDSLPFQENERLFDAVKKDEL